MTIIQMRLWLLMSWMLQLSLGLWYTLVVMGKYLAASRAVSHLQLQVRSAVSASALAREGGQVS